MSLRLNRICPLLLLGAARFCYSQTNPVFDESKPDRIEIRNQFYTVAFGKQNGEILSIFDRDKNVELTDGSKAGCLWTANVVRGQINQFTGGCAFAPQSSNTFQYIWDPAARTLTFRYNSPDSAHPTALATLFFSDRASFDMQLQIQNRTNGVIEAVGWPGSLLLRRSSIQAAFLPHLIPGVRLLPSFFNERRNAAQTYPGQLCFSDLMGVVIDGSMLSVRGINPNGPVRPVQVGLFDNESQTPGSYATVHSFNTRVRSFETFSSPLIRVQVGGTIESVMEGYRVENGINRYPTVQEKLGDRFEDLSRAPMVRADFQVFGRPLSQWTTDLNRIQRPSLIHLVGFQPGGHDKSYPDHLPPNPSYGTTADLRRFAEAARSQGSFVMPHTNYSWWDGASPTLRSLTAPELNSLMVQAPAGVPLVETYGNGIISNDGYVVSPSVARTQSRIQDGWRQWRNEAAIDTLFLDQLGSRNEVIDLNPAVQSPFEYFDQWLSLMGKEPNMFFATEGGWDRLANRMWGFFGSALSSQRSTFRPQDVQWGVGSPANDLFGPGNWEPFPIASFLFHDKVFFYQHNLEITSYTETLEVLTWNTIFGYHQSLLWPGTPTRSPDPQWVDLAQSMQRAVTARQAGKTLDEFIRINHDLAGTRFGDITTIANWDTRIPYSTVGSRIVPNGFISYSKDLNLIAGTFEESFSGQPLSPGMHALILERNRDFVSLRHPMGAQVSLSLDAPDRWSPGMPLATSAIDRDKNFIGYINRIADGRQVALSTAPVNGIRPSRLIIQGVSELALADAAAFQLGPIAPGQMLSLFGTGIGPAQNVGARVTAGRIATELSGIRILFDGLPAPLLFAGPNQINAIAPFEIARLDSVLVEVERNGSVISSVYAPVVNAMPRLFTTTGTGSGLVAALNENGTQVTAQNAARRGAVVVLYGTGAGLENGNPITGELSRDASRTVRQPVTVTIDGRNAEVLFSGAAPGYAGLLQLNVRVPLLSARGNSIPVEVKVGNAPSQAQVTIAIQ